MEDEITVARTAEGSHAPAGEPKLRRASFSYQEFGGGALTTEVHTLLVAASDLRHVRRTDFAVAPDAVDTVAALPRWTVAASQINGEDEAEFVLCRDGVVASVDIDGGRARVKISARSQALAGDEMAMILGHIGAPDPEVDQTRVMFWANTKNGPICRSRDVGAPNWELMTENYAMEARTGMSRLLQVCECPEARLILWHGPPGTGKTHALRALSRAWSPWCATHYITDPEKFVDEVASYLLQVVSHRDEFGSSGSAPTKLLVLEDAGELMSPPRA